MVDPATQARLHLILAQGVGPLTAHRLEDAFGSPVDAVHGSVSQLKTIEGIGPKRANDIRRALDDVDLQPELDRIAELNLNLVSHTDDNYPLLLKHIHDPPPLLFVRGQLQRTDSVSLAVVGSRKCSTYGREQADRLAAGCAQAGLTIVSGGARGIDTAAHRGALRATGRTVAVLGCGHSHTYPPENKDLFDDIAQHGAVISELPTTAPPIAEHFPRRNRIISGLSLGILVVEAAIRSGALITARLAAEEHHREVLALPGRIDSPASNGCHKMIREGWAALVTGVPDILDALGETGQLLKASQPEPVTETETQTPESPAHPAVQNLTPTQQQLYHALSPDPTDLDTLTRTTGLPIAQINADLTLFQLRGLVERVGGNRVRRRR